MFSYGNKFRVTIYGASHEESMGLIIDGISPGTKIDLERIKNDLKRRRPGDIGTTSRLEEDDLKIKNGVFNGLTTGAPLHIEVKNNNIKSSAYDTLKTHHRPNHADFVANKKYNGFNDYRGGGFFSGRMTTLLVIAGSIAKSIIPYQISSELLQVGTCKDLSKLDAYLQTVKDKNDSVGGILEVRVSNMTVGLGNPYFEKLDANIAKLVLTVPGVRGIIFGDQFDVTSSGSNNNDLLVDETGKTCTNHSGGIVGGISNGNDIVFKVFVKPTSSIGLKQDTFDFKENKVLPLEIEGRHDVAFVRRIAVVLESVTALVLINS
ncbi:MAG: chorismate synthase [Acholeplasma sp.]|nr:chorismate synthase [Acholeplasma sp.]